MAFRFFSFLFPFVCFVSIKISINMNLQLKLDISLRKVLGTFGCLAVVFMGLHEICVICQTGTLDSICGGSVVLPSV